MRVRALLCTFRAVLGRVARGCAAGVLAVSPFPGVCYEHSWCPGFREDPAFCTSCCQASTTPRRLDVDADGAGDGAHRGRDASLVKKTWRAVTPRRWPAGPLCSPLAPRGDCSSRSTGPGPPGQELNRTLRPQRGTRRVAKNHPDTFCSAERFVGDVQFGEVAAGVGKGPEARCARRSVQGSVGSGWGV